MNLRPLCIHICRNRYVSKQLIYFWKLNCGISNLEVLPIRIHFCNRSSKLEINLLINTIVNNGDDLALVEAQQGCIDLGDCIL